MPRTEPTGGNGMPTFARPLIPRPEPSVATSPSVLSPALTAVSLITLSCAALFLIARPNGAQNLPGSKSTGRKQSAAVTKSTAADAQSAASVSADRQDLSFYTSNVRGGMFSAPVPPPPKQPAVVKALPKPKPVIVPLPPINPFAQWSYTGTVHMGDITMALLENTQTKEGQYVKSGDSFMGAQVKSITDQMVVLTSAGKPEMLAKADTIVVTPLNQDAPGKNGPQQNGQPQNGQPQNGQVQAAAPANNSQLSITLPNGRVLTGDRAQRYKQRLDQGFGGGNNGGGFGGGGFGGGGGRRGGRGFGGGNGG